MFFHVSSQKKKQLPHYFSSLIIQFHYCNLRSLFLICPHNCSKKNGYTIFSSVFEDVRYPFVFVAFSLRQNAATFFFCDWFFRLIFSGHCFHFLRTCSNVQKTRLHHLFHIVLKMLIVVFSVLFTFLLRCVAKKKRGYTFVGPNAKKCVIHGHSMF